MKPRPEAASARAVAVRSAPDARREATDAPWHDPVYRGVAACRDADALRTALTQALAAQSADAPRIVSAQVLQCHYKPFARARLVCAVRTADGATRSLFLCLYAEPARAVAKHATTLAADDASARRWPPLLLPDCIGVGWWLPDGPKLAAIDVCFDHAAWRGFLAAQGFRDTDRPLPKLVRYVPRKRALFRVAPADGAGGLYLKCYRAPGDVQAADNLMRIGAAWERGALAFRPPRLVFHDRERQAVAMDEVPGQRLTEVMTQAAPAPMQRVGVALASLHASGIASPLRWTADAELAALKAAMADLARALPALGVALDALVGELAQRAQALAFDAAATVHGNLFGDQILIDGDRVGIVDWDDLALGDPLYDLGRLIAHLLHVHAGTHVAPVAGDAAITALLRGYGQRVDAPRLRWQVAVALLMRAKISALRALPDGWAAQAAHALEQARAVLAARIPIGGAG